MSENKSLLLGSKLRHTKDSIKAPFVAKNTASTIYGELLSSAPQLPKKQSLYVRFKKIILENARSEKDFDTIRNINQIAKMQWNLVKNIDTSVLENHGNFTDEVKYLVVLKEQAEYGGVVERNSYDSSLAEWCSRFQSVAVDHLDWLTIDTTESNHKVLEDVVEPMEKLSNCSTAVNKENLDSFSGEVKEEIKYVQRSLRDEVLMEKLRNPSDGVLKQYLGGYREDVEIIETLEKEKAELGTICNPKGEDAQKAVEIDNTDPCLESEIIRNLERQMQYIGPGLRHSKKRISFNKGGVSADAFEAAFDVPKGTKKASIPAGKISPKCLRYGARLRCDDINVKLCRGDTIAATTYYSLIRFRIEYHH